MSWIVISESGSIRGIFSSLRNPESDRKMTQKVGSSLRLLADLWSAALGPAAMLLIMLTLMLLATITPDYSIVFILLSLPAWLRIASQLRAKQAHYKTSSWLIGQLKAKSKLEEFALLVQHSLEHNKEHLRYPRLKISVCEDKSEQGMWRLAIRNHGWNAVGPIHISSADLSDLIAPGYQQQEQVDESTLKQQIPEIKTGILLPLMSATALRKKLAGFDLASGSLVAHFYVHGGSEFLPASHRIDVDHPDGGPIAPDPGPLNKRSRYKPAPEIRYEYSSTGYIPVLATLADGTPYSGTGSGSNGIADWSGTFADGKPDGEFLLVLGDRQSSRPRFKAGVEIK